MILLEREKLLSELEQKIGYSFRARALLDRALTHRSFANERVAEKCLHNESLEFLGDAVLGFIVSAWLLERFPELSEGKLSKMKAYLVSEASLVELAEDIDLGRYILLNRGEEKTGGRQKRALLADAYEALIGVLYIDGGIGVAERFLRHELRHKVTAIDPTSMIGTDYKSALQEQLQARGWPAPDYAVVEVLGPDHRRTFRVELRVAGRAIARGEGHTIKIAQQDAARAALADPGSLDRIADEEGRRLTVESYEDQTFGGPACSLEAEVKEAEASHSDDNRPPTVASDELPSGIDDRLSRAGRGAAGAGDSPGRMAHQEKLNAQMTSTDFAGPAGASLESGDGMELSADAKSESEARGVATDA
ncbi:MAG TPA: ribonuclease III [Blastocatellia bacterium]|jgi:ribonuclease-3|nr:ribonuclease III [Blastocatellia bacterium]